jgi:LmbE family N-acetylglucosaminyl deacetylase
MNKLRFFIEKAAPKVLCLGAHADDIEIGCG